MTMADHQTSGAVQTQAVPGDLRVERALLTVFDKRGVVDFARALADLGVEIISTGGTAAELAEHGIETRSIEDYTGFPEILDGRVKTLHPSIFAGLLAVRSREEHRVTLAEHGIAPIDLVVVNLYPFERTAARRGVTEEEVIDHIDIGGPTLIRAAAKNHAHVGVIVRPESYDAVIEEMSETGGVLSAQTRESLATEAFGTTARYDAGDLTVVLRARGRLPQPVRGRLREGARPLLRREPAPARRVLRAGRDAHTPAGPHREGPRQGAFVQQPARPRLRAPAGERVRGSHRRDHQAQQPVWRRDRRDGDRGVRARARVAIRRAPTAAWWS